MKILIVHNRYRQPGGEDEVVRAETEMLREAGHTVHEYVRSNDEIAEPGPLARAGLAGATVWSRTARASLGRMLVRLKPDVAHFHNTLPLISPAAYYACRDARVPAIQTLHNYRLICPSASLFREGRVCEACVDHGLISGVRYGCYRNSRGATAAVASMLATHRLLGTWREQVDAYIALTEFGRQKLVAAGLPAHKVVVKPNFVHPDPGERTESGMGALFVGRLAPEKGVRTLLAAWERVRGDVSLELLGDGPGRSELESAATGVANVRFRGRVARGETVAAMKDAQFLIFPSEWYEGLPMTIIEAFACGVPVIASRLGAMEEIVADGRTGLHFTPGDAADLAAKIEWAVTHPREMEVMGRAARAEYEAKYTATRNYELLMAIYARAIEARRGSASTVPVVPADSVSGISTIGQEG